MTSDTHSHSEASKASLVPVLAVDWSKRTGIGQTTPTLQVVVNPKLMPGETVRENAYSAFRELNPDYVRYVPWFPYPHQAVAELDAPTETTTSWDFTHVDPPTIDFLEATKGRHPIVNFSTIPAWMFVEGEVEYPSDPREIFFGYNKGVDLVDPSGKQLGDYFARLVSWYSKGGFTDELGARHESGHSYDIPIWEVLNEADSEHETTPQAYTERYDIIVKAIRSINPDTEFVGLGIAQPSLAPEYFEYFLDPANHQEDIPLDWISYHFYAIPVVAESFEDWQHSLFSQTDGFIATVRYVESIRKRLSPSTRTMINEVGVILPEDILAIGSKNIDEPSFPEAYWNLAGALYAHLVVELTKIGIDVVGASQLVGYPGQFPSVSMVSWETGAPNARFRVLELLREAITPGIELVADPVWSAIPGTARVLGVPDRLPFIQDGVKRMLLVNRGADSLTTELPGAEGGSIRLVDVESAGGPIQSAAVTSSSVGLGPYAVAVVTYPL